MSVGHLAGSGCISSHVCNFTPSSVKIYASSYGIPSVGSSFPWRVRPVGCHSSGERIPLGLSLGFTGNPGGLGMYERLSCFAYSSVSPITASDPINLAAPSVHPNRSLISTIAATIDTLCALSIPEVGIKVVCSCDLGKKVRPIPRTRRGNRIHLHALRSHFCLQAG